MTFLAVLGIVLLAVSVNCRDIVVTNANELSSALLFVDFNDTIHLQDGIYNGNFVINRSGYWDVPITITGSKNAILTSSNYGLYMHRANNWILRGFTIQNSVKGIFLEESSYNMLDDLHVFNIDEEGISLITDSKGNTIQNCNIHDTGRKNASIGAGISFGESLNDWLNGQHGYTDNNNILNSTIGPNIPVECVDLKEGTVGGTIRGNYFNSLRENGESLSESSLSVKGDYYIVEDNISDNSRLFGFDLTEIVGAGDAFSACENVVKNNKCKNLPSGGQCAINRSTHCSNSVDNNEQV